MMTTPRDFRSVRAALVEGNGQLRSDMRYALLEKGVRELTACRDVESFMDIAGRETLDLVICNSNTFDGQFTPTMQRIRQNGLGGNPFVVVIATLDEPSPGQVQQALNGGVDDLMGKPAQAKKIVDRVDFLVKGRKPFIATSSYVGPTRANFAAAGAEGDLIEVPNTLRSKVVEKASDLAVRRAIVNAAAELKEKIAEHPLTGIDRLIRRALASHSVDDRELRSYFANLHALCQELGGHYRTAGFSHIADLAAALSKLANSIMHHTPPGPNSVDRDLLQHLSYVVRGAIASETESTGVVHEIAAMVERYAGGGKAKSRLSSYH